MNFFNAILTPNLPLIMLQSAIQFCFFFYSIIKTVTEVPTKSLGSWNRYQAMGLLIINSGLISNLFQCFLLYLDAENFSRGFALGVTDNTRYGKILLFSHLACILPFLLSHCIPGIIIYLWVPILILLFIMYPLNYLKNLCTKKNKKVKENQKKKRNIYF